MFKTNGEDEYNDRDDQAMDDTVIGKSIKIEGDLVSNGSITVEGEVVGSVKTDLNLRVGEKAKVKATVQANEAYIAGTVDGNVKVFGKLELSSTAVINGDIEASVLQIDAGAIFNGKCSMTENSNNSKKSEVKNEDLEEKEEVLDNED